MDEGRRPHDILPNISERLRMKHLQPGPGLVHYLSGHGPYGSYLKRIKCSPDNNCNVCKVTETPEQVLFECEQTRPLGGEERERLSGSSIREALLDPGLCGDLNALANRISRQRRQEFNRNTHARVVVEECVATNEAELRRSTRLSRP